ncbi:DNA dC-_dU-editing enzyme APOBEC-3C isoform X2 [Equus asinus]|uniref:DNA dC->dU-editing enzyme APOBEC-3C isoform X2 n=2 Tax=Equus asinus TaxID=9793 RepID=UPI0038F7A577
MAARQSRADSRGLSGCCSSSTLMLPLSVSPPRREAPRGIDVGDTPLDQLSHQWRGLQPAPPLRSQTLSCSLQPGPGPSPSLASLLSLSLCNSVGSCPTDRRALPRGRAREKQKRNPMEKLHRKTFSFHFRNLEFAYGRNCSYLCYQVEGRLSGSPGLSEQGVFVNEVCGKTRRHAELCFLDWFHDRLSPDEYYRVTWFISWSPCSYCAREVADFLKQHRNVKLSIFAARLYYYRDHVQGLRSLCSSGAQLAIMFFWDFRYCWDNFVYNSGRPFIPWKKINVNSDLLATKLEDILK